MTNHAPYERAEGPRPRRAATTVRNPQFPVGMGSIVTFRRASPIGAGATARFDASRAAGAWLDDAASNEAVRRAAGDGMTSRGEKPAADEATILLRDDAGGVATLTLNRVAARNALSLGLMAALQREIDTIAGDDTVRVVVIAANGPAFCAGHDLRELRDNPGRQAYEAVFAQCSALMMSITRLAKPVIARVHATATAAGCQLVATCDLAIAAETAKFATPGVDIGLFCSTPMVAVSRNLPRKQTMAMLLTGEPIDAATAAAYGLINRAVPEDALDAAVAGLAATIIAKSPLTLAIGKEAFYRQLDMTLADAYAHASEVMTRNMLTRDAGEGIDAFLEKRPPQWEGR